MINPEHTFPLPEFETVKLDEVKEQIRHQPALQRAAALVRSNPWAFVALAAAVGLLVGFWGKR